jgi:membrane-bound lytic murein transglycosylase B
MARVPQDIHHRGTHRSRRRSSGKSTAERIDRVAEDTGSAPEMLVGIIGVETYYGRITGRHRVLDALVTLAFEYPPRSAFFSVSWSSSCCWRASRASRSRAGGLLRRRDGDAAVHSLELPRLRRRRRWRRPHRLVEQHGRHPRQRRQLFQGVHGWRPGEPVVAPAVTCGRKRGGAGRPGPERRRPPSARCGTPASDSRDPAPRDPAATAGLFALEHEDGPRYWAGFHNFYVITRYNRSLMYALAVHQLGEAIRLRIEEQRDAA